MFHFFFFYIYLIFEQSALSNSYLRFILITFFISTCDSRQYHNFNKSVENNRKIVRSRRSINFHRIFVMLDFLMILGKLARSACVFARTYVAIY